MTGECNAGPDLTLSVFAAELRAARARQRMTQEAVAQAVNISRVSYIHIEKERHCPSLAIAVRIAKVLHISLDTLL